MCGDNFAGPVDRWSQALYAMEVFATMLGESDEMNVFLMTDSGANPISVSGSDTGRVEKIIGGLGTTGNTPYDTVRAAAGHITAADASASRWLVVLTDGAFQQLPSQGLEASLAEYAAQGIQVVYLGIGAAEMLSGDPAGNFYGYSANSSTEILPCITEIANQIFQQQVLPASHITTSGNTMTLDIDIPVSQLLVFAQGEGIQVESLELDGSALQPTETHTVEVTEANTPVGWQGQTILADGLCGVVQTYAAGDTPYAKGTYTLTVSDPSHVEILSLIHIWVRLGWRISHLTASARSTSRSQQTPFRWASSSTISRNWFRFRAVKGMRSPKRSARLVFSCTVSLISTSSPRRSEKL